MRLGKVFFYIFYNLSFNFFLNLNLLFQVEIEGLTGDVRFNDEGRRQNYTLQVVEMTVNSAMVKVIFQIFNCVIFKCAEKIIT